MSEQGLFFVWFPPPLENKAEIKAKPLAKKKVVSYKNLPRFVSHGYNTQVGRAWHSSSTWPSPA